MNAEMAAAVAWLRSPAGELWSRSRIANARAAEMSLPPAVYAFSGRDLGAVEGFFSIRLG